MKNLLSSLVFICLSASLASAADVEQIVKHLQNVFPAVENMSLKNCTGPIAAMYFTSQHSTNGIYLSLTPVSMIRDIQRVDFSIGSSRMQVDNASLSGNEIIVNVTNTNTDIMTRSAESKSYELTVSELNSDTLRVGIENRKSFMSSDYVECLIPRY